MSVKVKETICQALYDELKKVVEKDYFCKNTRKKFLITGGSGFIAYYMVLALLCLNDEKSCGNHITILVRNEDKAKKKYGALLDRNDFDLLVQDVCKPLYDIGTMYDYIVHAASAASAQQFDADPIGVFNSNVVGTEHLIDFIRRCPCESMVYVSSFTVYGNGTEELKEIPETYCGSDDWCTNRSCYSLGKRSAEFLCMAAYRKYQCPIRIVRPGFVYGASTPADRRVYAEIIRKVAENQPITLQSAGFLFRSMVYVTDVVRGIFHVLFCGKDGEAYNVANEFASIRDFAERAVTAAKSKDVRLEFVNKEDAEKTVLTIPGGRMSIRKICETGWKPEVPLELGIEMAAQIYTNTYLTSDATH